MIDESQPESCELLQVIFANNTIDHILSCKAVSQAGYYIVDNSLYSLLAANAIGVTLPAEIIDPVLSIESEDVAITDDATKDAESVST